MNFFIVVVGVTHFIDGVTINYLKIFIVFPKIITKFAQSAILIAVFTNGKRTKQIKGCTR